VRPDRFGRIEDAVDVDLHDLVPIFDRSLQKGAARENAGVIHQDVDSSEPGRRRIHQRLHVLLIRNIAIAEQEASGVEALGGIAFSEIKTNDGDCFGLVPLSLANIMVVATLLTVFYPARLGETPTASRQSARRLRSFRPGVSQGTMRFVPPS